MSSQPATHSREELGALLEVIADHLEIVQRRIARSGVGYFAVTRFDAVVHIAGYGTKDAARLDGIESTLWLKYRQLASKIAALEEDNPLLRGAYRSAKSKARRDEIIGEIFELSGFTLDARSAAPSLSSTQSDSHHVADTDLAEAPLAISLSGRSVSVERKA